MKIQRIGDFTVQSVVEHVAPYIGATDMFPAATPEAIARHLDDMAPAHIEAATGKLIMAFQSFILQTPRHTILIDTCVGEDKERANPGFHMKKWPWMQNLHALGLTPEDIDIVMCSHLHPDHVGWNTQLVDGRWVPTFPNARYVFARDEYQYWEAENAKGAERVGLTFMDSVLPVMEAGQAILVDNDHAVEDGVWLEPTPGHSPGHVVINVESGGERGALIGDLMHHPIQVPHADWSTCFCWDMDMSSASRTKFVDAHTDTGTLILPVHFAGETAGRIVDTSGTPEFAFVAR
jgi:glyoxylase-like metal-dependent hydrolase (beta-lactamase superfamily II)